MAQMMLPKIVSADDIAKHLQVNAAHVRDRISKHPKFPKPIVGSKELKWLEDEVTSFFLLNRK